MPKYLKRIHCSWLAAFALTFASAAAFAHDYAKADLHIDHPWARPTRVATLPAAVYFDIENRGEADDRLIAARTDRAAHVELHLSEMTEDGRATMRVAKDGFIAPAGSETSLEAGHFHVMLIGLDGALKEGESFPMVLTFEKAGEVEVIINVEDRQSEADSGHAHH